MELKSGTLDKWRSYFWTANSDIFGIIEHAIMVASSDCPKEFRLRRDRIAEILFSCKRSGCFGCDRVELAVAEGDEDEVCKSGLTKESKVNSGRDENGEMNNVNPVSNYSFGEAEALTDEIEEESQIVGEILRIKQILDNSEDESDSVLFDSLRRLQLMDLSVETLKATEIGKVVNALRKHASKEIQHLARTLIEVWKEMVDAWANATAAIAGAEGTPQSLNPSVLDEEEGLPSPPLDDLAFFATQTTSIELSQFFDGMDDDGNPRNSGEFNKNQENGRKPPVESHNIPKRKQQLPNESSSPPKDKGEQMKKEVGLMKKQATIVKPNKPSSIPESGPGRPTKPNVEQKTHNEMKFQQRLEKATIQKRPPGSQQKKSSRSDESTVKLEATKRKLHESYQQVENAKKQRTIQVMELHDLPKQGLAHKNPHQRPGNHIRHWANGRR